ncbi:hypothetical protein GIB67_003854 [Kingdonia uniflora]|uniref:RNase H type-1 domain-containing protein n=1 Tax=Kingdonia uniflora TaxID=39325 RepID=A0A7J7NYU6_9MAGN|nr:hypothetical protein GIB67_003854 [Kingdonia uniflora]
MEYWEEKSLLSISRTVGRLVQVDENTLNAKTRFYASVLTEIDLAKPIPSKIFVEGDDEGFMQEVVIGHLTKFCNNCKVIWPCDTLAIMPVVAETWADLAALDKEDGLSEEEELGVYDKVNDVFVTPVKALVSTEKAWVTVAKKKRTNKTKNVIKGRPPLTGSKSTTIFKHRNNVSKLGLKEYGVDLICNEHDGVPNLWILWKLGRTKPVVLSSTDQQITVCFEDVMLTFIHPNCDIARRRTLWRDLGNINGNMAPWLVVGDFNVILSSGEKKGGVPSSNTAISDFQNCVDALELIQCPSKGLKYTWCNMQRGNNRILLLLDRIFMNSKWAEKFGNWSYKVYPRVNSDHSPLVGKCVFIPRPSNSPFKFCKMWLGHEGFNLSRKLKVVKVAIRDWSQEVFGHSDRNIKKLNAEIEVVHRDMEQDVSNDCLSAQLIVLNNSLNKAMLDQEILWKQKSRVVSKEKNKIFMGSVYGGRKDGIIALFDFKVGSFPEKYLGIPLIQGRVTKHAILPLLDKIRARASSWAGRLLSFQGRVTLVKSVLCSLPVYNMGVYKWPQSVIKEGGKIRRNFIWSENRNIRKFHTIALKKVCRPVAEGGLGIRRLGEINEALLMKQAWVLLEGRSEWPKFMHAKFFTKFGEIVGYALGSSMWKGISLALSRVANKCDRDKLIWRPDLQGKFSTNSAFNNIRERANTVWWHKFVWKKCIHPIISSFAWRTIKRQILNAIQDAATLSVGGMQNCIFDLQIIAKLGVLSKARKPSRVRSVYWSLPEQGEVKINIDRAALGNPGKGGEGGVFRASDGEVLGAISVGLPIVTTFIAECSAIIESIEHCSSMGWEIAWVEGDSMVSIQAFSNDAIPWVLDARWKILKK